MEPTSPRRVAVALIVSVCFLAIIATFWVYSAQIRFAYLNFTRSNAPPTPLKDLPLPFPPVFAGPEGGCGSFALFKFAQDPRQAVSLHVNVRAFDNYQQETVLHLDEHGKDVRVTFHEWTDDARHSYCNDVSHPSVKLVSQWDAIAGTVTFQVVAPRQPGSDRYTVVATLRDARFKERGSKRTFTVKQL